MVGAAILTVDYGNARHSIVDFKDTPHHSIDFKDTPHQSSKDTHLLKKYANISHISDIIDKPHQSTVNTLRFQHGRLEDK